MISPDDKKAQKARTSDLLRIAAANLDVRVGQVWRHVGAISLIDPQRRLHATGKLIRIVQVAGQGRARTTRFTLADPPRGGNGGFDHQSHRIDAGQLARAWELEQLDDNREGRSC